MKLKPGPNRKDRINVKNTRGMAFCGLASKDRRSADRRTQGTGEPARRQRDRGITIGVKTMATIPPRQTSPEPASSSAQTTKAGSAAKSSVGTGDRGAAPADDPHPKSGASAPPENLRKTKRTLTPDNFLKTVANFLASVPVLLASLVRPKVSFALREKVFLAVTSINDCRFCEGGHTHWARANGVPLEEVNQILGLQIESLEARNPAEAAAILFAQHYAEHRDQFDPESIENLRKHYSDAQVDEILAYVRAITLGNLTGNTVDAFLDRFRSDGYTSSHGHASIFFEGLVAAAAASFALVLILLAKIERKLGIAEMRSRWHQPRRDAPPNPDSSGDSSWGKSG
jgi:AhpD family alkylhydroperoxidase